MSNKKVKKFTNELDGENVNQTQMRDASNQTLIDKVKDLEDGDVDELVRRFEHALDCLAQPSIYHRLDVENFVKGIDNDLLPRTPKEK